MVAVILISRCLLGPPILFTQRRLGVNGHEFYLLKFRSMTDARDASGRLLPDAERITPWGRFLRNTSIDELPSLWNVLKGDMSLIGPRPFPVGYEKLYTPEQARRLYALPGITGWAGVNGRNAQSWEKIIEYDVWYVDHLTFSLDLRILFLTIRVVLCREGIDRGEHNHNSEFQRRLEVAAREHMWPGF